MLAEHFAFGLDPYPGANLGCSRGGGDFQKIFENFVELFFRSTKLIFRAHQSIVLSVFWPNFGQLLSLPAFAKEQTPITRIAGCCEFFFAFLQIHVVLVRSMICELKDRVKS